MVRRRGAAAARRRAALSALLLAAVMAACSEAPPPTAEEALAFVTGAEASLVPLRQEALRTAWRRDTLGGADPTAAAAAAEGALASTAAELARGAARFDGLDLPAATARKLAILKAAPPAVAPDRQLDEELADITAELQRTWRASAYCAGAGADCSDLTAVERTAAELQDTDGLLDLWTEGRALTTSMRPLYERLVDIANAGAAALGHADAGARWRSAYGLTAVDFRAELNRLWSDVQPLLESLHCLVRDELGAEYGTAIAPPGGMIPAHLLGDFGDGRWSAVHDLVAPPARRGGYDPTRQITRRVADPLAMARYAGRFFVSLGFEPLPDTFWTRSRFARPAAPDITCRPRAWNLDGENDLRVTTCLEVSDEDFVAVHRALTRTYYRWAFRPQDPLFRDAGPAFMQAAAGAVALSVTPGYLVEIDLADRAPAADDEIRVLLRRALDELPALGFALLADRWRWRVFSGEIGPDRYDRAWWSLREAYQGVREAPLRSDTAFAPGAARLVAANRPYAPEFVAGILQYQIHGALCAAAGDDGPLHRCTVFGSPAAGARLRTLMEMGAGAPWAATLEAVTGSRSVDASALLAYYAPLAAWLDERNDGRSCGW